MVQQRQAQIHDRRSMQSGWCGKILGVHRVRELISAYSLETQKKISGSVSSITLFYAVVAASLPALSYLIQDSLVRLDAPTVAIGVATCLAVLFRLNTKLSIESISDWRKALRLTHTAFALGCIPIVAIILLYPDSIYQVHQYLAQEQVSGGTALRAPNAIWFVVSVSVWAGLTEEMIFRGMLISALRRWRGIEEQRKRDLFALCISSVVFGLAHMHSWGPMMSLALCAIGFGFGVAYIAIGEHLLPLVVYHIIFDALSLSVAILSSSLT